MWAIDTQGHRLKTAKIARRKKTKKIAKALLIEDKQSAFMRKTAQDIIDSGLLGSGEFMVSISGHANDNHVSEPGEQNDMVMLSIQKLPS